MSLRDEQDLLARVFTDPSVREEFFAAPDMVGRRFGLGDDESRRFAAAARDEVEFFSRTLFAKRANEVEKLVPETRRALGDGFRDQFSRFSAVFVPDSVKKHLDDAYRFTEFVIARSGVPAAVSAARLERARLAFYGYRKPFVILLRPRPRIFLRIGRKEFVR